MRFFRQHLLVSLLVALASAAGATTVIPISVEQMAARASTVVEARATDQWSAWDAGQHLIYTYTRFSVSRTLKGAAQQTLVVRQMGGSAGGYTQKVSGVRHWMPGEEAVLFLRPTDAPDGSLSVVGLMQGNFRVYREADGSSSATNGVPAASTLTGGRVSNYRGARLPLVELEKRVAQAVSR